MIVDVEWIPMEVIIPACGSFFSYYSAADTATMAASLTQGMTAAVISLFSYCSLAAVAAATAFLTN